MSHILIAQWPHVVYICCKNNIAIEHFHHHRKVYWTVLVESNGQKKFLLTCCLLLSTYHVSGPELSIICLLYYFVNILTRWGSVSPFCGRVR